MFKRIATLMLLTFMALMSAGCPCPATKLNVTVELDDAMRDKREAADVADKITRAPKKP